MKQKTGRSRYVCILFYGNASFRTAVRVRNGFVIFEVFNECLQINRTCFNDRFTSGKNGVSVSASEHYIINGCQCIERRFYHDRTVPAERFFQPVFPYGIPTNVPRIY